MEFFKWSLQSPSRDILNHCITELLAGEWKLKYTLQHQKCCNIHRKDKGPIWMKRSQKHHSLNQSSKLGSVLYPKAKKSEENIRGRRKILGKEMQECPQFGRKVQWREQRRKSEQETEMVTIISSSNYRNIKIVTHQCLICLFSCITTQRQ